MKYWFLDILKTIFLYTVLCVGTFLMTRTILLYTSFDETVAFLKYKQAYLYIGIWKLAFYVHVFSSILCLLAGFTQFSSYILTFHKPLHKLIGKIYVYNILFINFPVGLVMAYYANGLLPSKIAFFILDTLWFWFTLKAVIEIKKGNVLEHQKYMMRSYALTFSAITLRTWKLVLSSTLEIDPLMLYMIDAWLGFVPNLLVIEFLIWRKFKLSAKV